MPEPTEGPWSAPPSGAYGQWPVLGPNFEAIAFATAQPGDRWKAAANARRMAAAPDLLEALEAMLREYKQLMTRAGVDKSAYFRGFASGARAAIAKAKGETDA